MALVVPPYITEAQFRKLISDLEIRDLTDEGMQELLDRAVGMVEGKLSKRFVIPLVAESGGPYEAAPRFARNLVSNVIIASIRRLIGLDHNRNLVIEGTQKFIDTNKIEQDEMIKDLLEPTANLGFKLHEAAAGSIGSVQTIGLSRADHSTSFADDPWIP
ncbi:hypothetical protein [Bdellovibrio bacteriovorus]|uniref:hypothetical protein n=1 Tax=Bdellovibrio bacteriovorus TaxID=959 RepID=UPI003AA7E769